MTPVVQQIHFSILFMNVLVYAGKIQYMDRAAMPYCRLDSVRSRSLLPYRFMVIITCCGIVTAACDN